MDKGGDRLYLTADVGLGSSTVVFPIKYLVELPRDGRRRLATGPCGLYRGG